MGNRGGGAVSGWLAYASGVARSETTQGSFDSKDLQRNCVGFGSYGKNSYTCCLIHRNISYRKNSYRNLVV